MNWRLLLLWLGRRTIISTDICCFIGSWIKLFSAIVLRLQIKVRDCSERLNLLNGARMNLTLMFEVLGPFMLSFQIFWSRISWNLTKFQFIQTILIQLYFYGVRMSWNFVRFHEILNPIDAENFRLLSWQTKKFHS